MNNLIEENKKVKKNNDLKNVEIKNLGKKLDDTKNEKMIL